MARKEEMVEILANEENVSIIAGHLRAYGKAPYRLTATGDMPENGTYEVKITGDSEIVDLLIGRLQKPPRTK